MVVPGDRKVLGETFRLLKEIVPEILINTIVLETKVKDRKESHGLQL